MDSTATAWFKWRSSYMFTVIMYAWCKYTLYIEKLPLSYKHIEGHKPICKPL